MNVLNLLVDRKWRSRSPVRRRQVDLFIEEPDLEVGMTVVPDF
jgi:hypothetical protein